jgi:hypothetical protein
VKERGQGQMRMATLCPRMARGTARFSRNARTYGSSETSFAYSSSVQARAVRERTLP